MSTMSWLSIVNLFVLAGVASSTPDAVSRKQEVGSALTNITLGHDLSSLVLSDEARASLYSISNINMFAGQRDKPLVWPYWSLDCTACEAAAALIISLFDIGTPLEEIEAAVILLCIELNIEAPEVCDGAVHSFGYHLEYILQQGADITAFTFCGVFVGGDCGNQGQINDWTVEVPGDKPVNDEVSPPADEIDVINVLQLADVHIDLTYTQGNYTPGTKKH